MKTIKFKLADGQLVEMRMSDEQYESFKEVQRPYWREEKRKQRRGLSLEQFMEENDFEIADETQNLEALINRPTAEMQKALQLKMLQQGLKMLTDKQSRAIHKHFFLEMSYEEIAEEEGVSKVTIFNRVECALKKLKKLF